MRNDGTGGDWKVRHDAKHQQKQTKNKLIRAPKLGLAFLKIIK